MPSLNIEQFGDLVELTLNDYIKDRYVNLLGDNTEYVAAPQLINKSRMEKKAGPYLEWKVRLTTANSYEHIYPTTPDNAGMSDDFQSCSVPVRKIKTHWAILQEQMDFNASPNKIIDIAKAKVDGADFDFIEGIENDFFAFPSASDNNNFRSLPYWVTKNATEGFNGGIPTGYSNVADLSPTTYPRWNNWTGQYTNWTIDDGITMARTMAERTAFKPPVKAVRDLGAAGLSRVYLTNLTVKQKSENIADSRNDNLGVDLAKNDNMVLFRRAPIQYVPQLDRDTTNPFYQMNWDVFKTLVQQGWWQRKTMLKPVAGQRNMMACYYDSYMNFACFNRRVLGVLATGTSYPS